MKRISKAYKKTIRRVSNGHTKRPVPFDAACIYTILETASILRLNIKTARKVIANGELPASKMPGGVKVKGSDINVYLSKMLIFKDLPNEQSK